MTGYSPGTHRDGNTDLRALGDPEFFVHWAVIRQRLAQAPKGSAERPEIKRRYDAAAVEYRRRIDGGMPATA